MRPLPVPDDEVLFGATHELLALWARMSEAEQASLLKYAWVLMPERRRGEVREMASYDSRFLTSQSSIERRIRKAK